MKMKMEIQVDRKKLAIAIGVILAGLLLCLLAYNMFKLCRRLHFEHMYEKYEETFPEKYPEYLKKQYEEDIKPDIFKSVDRCTASIQREQNEYGIYEFYENYEITIIVDDLFDNYSDSEKYQFLEQANSSAVVAINTLRSDQCNGITDYGYKLDEIYGTLVSIDKDTTIRFKTTDHIYWLGGAYTHSVYMDGKQIAVPRGRPSSAYYASTSSAATSSSSTSHSTSGSTHTGSSNASKDPYHVNQYRDVEDFYYDNEDDFEDFEDAEDYYDEHHD